MKKNHSAPNPPELRGCDGRISRWLSPWGENQNSMLRHEIDCQRASQSIGHVRKREGGWGGIDSARGDSQAARQADTTSG